MSYYDNDYGLTGILFEDRQTVANALDDPSLSYEQKEEIVRQHNWKNDDFMSTDTYMNRIVFNVSTDGPQMYSSNDTTIYTPPKIYNVSLSSSDLFFDNKDA